MLELGVGFTDSLVTLRDLIAEEKPQTVKVDLSCLPQSPLTNALKELGLLGRGRLRVHGRIDPLSGIETLTWSFHNNLEGEKGRFCGISLIWRSNGIGGVLLTEQSVPATGADRLVRLKYEPLRKLQLQDPLDPPNPFRDLFCEAANLAAGLRPNPRSNGAS